MRIEYELQWACTAEYFDFEIPKVHTGSKIQMDSGAEADGTVKFQSRGGNIKQRIVMELPPRVLERPALFKLFNCTDVTV